MKDTGHPTDPASRVSSFGWLRWLPMVLGHLSVAVAPEADTGGVSPCSECQSAEAKALWWPKTGLNCPLSGPAAGVACDICTTTSNAAVCSTAKTYVVLPATSSSDRHLLQPARALYRMKHALAGCLQTCRMLCAVQTLE